MMDCLKYAYGITQSPCECLINDLPEDYNKSESGIYLDEVPEFPLNLKAVKSISDCGEEFPIILTKAIQGAERVFRVELFKALQTMYRARIKQFEGIVGSLTGTIPMPLTDPIAGLRLTARDFRGASVSVDKIYTAFSLAGSVTVTVYKKHYSDISLTPIKAVTLQTSAGALRENILDDPILLPLSDDTGKYIEYYFLYESAGNTPMNNDIKCNCGQKENDLREYVIPDGVYGPDIDHLSVNGKVNGILPHIVAECNTEDAICEVYNTNPNIRLVIQDTLSKKAVELLLVGILSSNLVNRYTMALREKMQYGAYGLAKKFNNNVQWIAENMDMTNNDCFICNPKSQGMELKGILS